MVCNAAGPFLKVCPSEIVDLGEFEESRIQTRNIYLKNTGDEPLTILKTFTSCTCTHLEYSGKEIAPGDSVAVTVTFNGRNRHPGPVRKIVRVTSNAENSIVGILVKGQIIPAVATSEF